MWFHFVRLLSKARGPGGEGGASRVGEIGLVADTDGPGEEPGEAAPPGGKS